MSRILDVAAAIACGIVAQEYFSKGYRCWAMTWAVLAVVNLIDYAKRPRL